MFFTKQETKQAEYFVNCVMFEISIDLTVLVILFSSKSPSSLRHFACSVTYNSRGIISHVLTNLQQVACNKIVMCHHFATVVAVSESQVKGAFAMKAFMFDPTTC